MEKIISACGLDCSKCGAYIAKQTDDDNVRKETAGIWSKEYHADIKPENINCDGCLAETGHFGYCNVCKIRLCALEKKVKACNECPEYKCDKFDIFG